MRHAILPVSAMILCRGKFLVSELIPGDRVQGFDYRSKRVTLCTILSVTPVESAQRVVVPVTRYKMVPVTKETIALAENGIEQPVVNSRQVLGFCQQKMQVTVRELGCPIELEGTAEAVELQWEWPEYIWFEGILVGTELL